MNLIRAPSPETVATHLSNAIKSALTANHVCHFNKCTIVNLKVEIHRQGDKYGINAKYLDTPSWVTPETIVDNIYSIYLCKETGSIHCCSANCDGEKMTNEDNCQVCCISGIQYQSESVRSWKISARCIPTVVANKQDPYMFSRDTTGRVKSSGVHNLKMTSACLIARNIITALLFSKRRMLNEMHKAQENKKDAEKVVNKYKRYCDRHSLTKNYMHMVTLYVSSINKRPLYTHLIIKTPEEKDEIIETYTKIIYGHYKMVLYKTILGKEMSSFFGFKAFVPACLYMIKSGLTMNGVCIMEKSRYLESALPEANTLDLYGISKPAFTQTKNNILKAIRETVEHGSESPQSLQMYSQKESEKVVI